MTLHQLTPAALPLLPRPELPRLPAGLAAAWWRLLRDVAEQNFLPRPPSTRRPIRRTAARRQQTGDHRPV